ncbi:MAG TPA: hypothetical protein VMF06_24505 [Candidatus Limnocylindria bacterium]|nr:hypothetical protein [Candidatus Limnocylindria bacterium]
MTPGESAAGNVLIALKRWEPELGELEAVTRERARRGFSGRCESTELRASSWYPQGYGARLLCLRSAAHLAVGECEEAFSDLSVVDDIRRSFSFAEYGELPLLMTEVQIAWEGLKGGDWTDQQLVGLQRVFDPSGLREEAWAVLQRRQENDIREADLLAKSVLVWALKDQGMTWSQEDWAHGFKKCLLEWPVQFDQLHVELLEAVRRTLEFGDTLGRSVLDKMAQVTPGWLRFRQASNVRQLNYLAGEMGRRWAAGEIDTSQYLQKCPSLSEGALELYHGEGRDLVSTADSLEQWLKLACAACAIERFRISHGRLPDGIDEWWPYLISANPITTGCEGAFTYTKVDSSRFTLETRVWRRGDLELIQWPTLQPVLRAKR